jgi:hypothetical protein
MGVSIWGYGVRPKHTIEKWLPGLHVSDYLELNRLCLLDEMPRNSESKFLSIVCDRIKTDFPAVKVLLSWADGLRGKPGFVYQACSWLYGGFINSEFYTNQRGEVIHPRLLITRYGSRGKAIQKALDLNHYFGKQFMYCRFLCSKSAKRHLLRDSPFTWGNDYPKGDAISFAVARAGGERQKLSETPFLQGRNADASLVLGTF